MTDDIAPTPEQFRKAEYVPPEVNQSTNRRGWRKLSLAEQMHNRGEIEYYQLRAWEKWEKHYNGALGANVSNGDGDRADADTEFPRTYHAQKVAEVKHTLRSIEWIALEDIILGGTLETIGRKWRFISSPRLARTQGLVIVCEALEALANLWGMK